MSSLERTKSIEGGQIFDPLDEVGFGLYSHFTYDRFTKAFGIGYNSTMPENVIRGIVAAELSAFLGVSSNTAAKYLQEAPYSRTSRFDQTFQKALLDHIDAQISYLTEINKSGSDHLGKALSDSALASARSAVGEAFVLADRGALFEVCALARMCVEQLSWASQVSSLSNADEIRRVRAQSSISYLKTCAPSVGEFYGWLSEHAHWHLNGHIKSLVTDGEYLKTLTHSVIYKIQSYAVLTVLVMIFQQYLVWQIKGRGGVAAAFDSVFFHDKFLELNTVVGKICEDYASTNEAIRQLQKLLVKT